MKSVKVYLFFFSVILCCALIITFVVGKNGETIDVIEGRVQRCEYLGGIQHNPIPHATINTVTGSYVTAMLPNCERGLPVNVLVKRGAFYFNLVFYAEKMSER